MTDRYTRTALALHWLVALLIFAAFPLGIYMHDLPLSPHKLRLFSYHKWIGVTVFLLAAIRLSWRFTHRPPPMPDSMPNWEKLGAETVHYLLYALIFVIPVTGWLMSSAKGFQTVWFGLLPLPDLVPKDKVLGDRLLDVHITLNFLMGSLLCVHIGAALKHYYIDHDEILARMLPFLRRPA